MFTRAYNVIIEALKTLIWDIVFLEYNILEWKEYLLVVLRNNTDTSESSSDSESISGEGTDSDSSSSSSDGSSELAKSNKGIWQDIYFWNCARWGPKVLSCFSHAAHMHLCGAQSIFLTVTNIFAKIQGSSVGRRRNDWAVPVLRGPSGSTESQP